MKVKFLISYNHENLFGNLKNRPNTDFFYNLWKTHVKEEKLYNRKCIEKCPNHKYCYRRIDIRKDILKTFKIY